MLLSYTVAIGGFVKGVALGAAVAYLAKQYLNQNLGGR